MRSAEPWIPGRERAGPLGCFSIPVTSLFRCVLHTPELLCGVRLSPARGALSSYIGGSCSKNVLPRILRNTWQYCTPVSEVDGHFNFTMKLIQRWCFWQENEDQQYLISQGSAKHSCWLLFVPNRRIWFYIWRTTQRIGSVRKGAVSSARIQITTHSDSKRVKNIFFLKIFWK